MKKSISYVLILVLLITLLLPITAYAAIRDGDSEIPAISEGVDISVTDLVYDNSTAQLNNISGVSDIDYSQPHIISEIFPDPNLAQVIADWLGLRVDDTISRSDVSNSDFYSLHGFIDGADFENKGIENLEGMQIFEGVSVLKGLSLTLNNIKDLSPLSNLTSLESLDVYGNDITDLSPITTLTNLKVLSAGLNPISDVSPIVNLVNLEHINLNACKITDLSPLIDFHAGGTDYMFMYNTINWYEGTNKIVKENLGIPDFQQQYKLLMVPSSDTKDTYNILKGGKTNIGNFAFYSTTDGISFPHMEEIYFSEFSFISSDPSIAQVVSDSNGAFAIEGYEAGTTQITAYVWGIDSDYTKYTFSVVVGDLPPVYGSVTVQYVNEKENWIAPIEQHDNLPYGEYTYTAPKIDGYILNDEASKTVTIDETEAFVVTFRYRQAFGSITLRYVDNNGSSIIPDYTQENLPMGEYSYNAPEIYGYALDGDSFKVVALTEDNLDITVIFSYKEYAVGDILFSVIDEETLNPIEGAEVNYSGVSSGTIFTDASGQAYVVGIPLGYYSAIAIKEGYATNSSNGTIDKSNPVAVIEITLSKTAQNTPTGTIVVRYLDDKGNSIAPDEVFSKLPFGEYTYSALQIAGYILADEHSKTTNIGNAGEVQKILFSYKLKTQSEPKAESEKKTETKEETEIIEEKPTQPQIIQEHEAIIEGSNQKSEPEAVKICGTVRGRAVDIYGNPMANVRIELHSNPRITYTDNNGYYSFENVELGVHKIIVVDERLNRASKYEIIVDETVLANVKETSLLVAEGALDRTVDIVVTPKVMVTDKVLPQTGDKGTEVYIPILFMILGTFYYAYTREGNWKYYEKI